MVNNDLQVVGIWRRSKRAFTNTMKYGIKFPLNEIQFGKSVHILELCVYLDELNRINYCGYSKPTDAKRYLNPNSFHPRSVFNSIPFSQMLRTLRNNSEEGRRAVELQQCVDHFSNSGYDLDKLNELKLKATNHLTTNKNQEDKETITFPVHFFDKISEFRAVLNSLKETFMNLIGDTRIILALKKGSSIGNAMVRNKQLSLPNTEVDSQHCQGRGCMQCPQVLEESDLMINGKYLRIPNSLNCKSRNIIYLWVCKLCNYKEAYFGRTTQECHDRSSGHRGCFSDEKWEKSALSMHAKEAHQTTFSLNIFSIAVIKKTSPQRLQREEYKHIDKFKTNSLGLNRYKV